MIQNIKTKLRLWKCHFRYVFSTKFYVDKYCDKQNGLNDLYKYINRLYVKMWKSQNLNEEAIFSY